LPAIQVDAMDTVPILKLVEYGVRDATLARPWRPVEPDVARRQMTEQWLEVAAELRNFLAPSDEVCWEIPFRKNRRTRDQRAILHLTHNGAKAIKGSCRPIAGYAIQRERGPGHREPD